MAARTLQIVEKDIKRVKRAERKLRSNYNAVHRHLARFGGIDGLPKKGKPVPTVAPKLSTYVRMQREISKSLAICLNELKSLEVERVALTAAESEKDDEYSL